MDERSQSWRELPENPPEEGSNDGSAAPTETLPVAGADRREPAWADLSGAPPPSSSDATLMMEVPQAPGPPPKSSRSRPWLTALIGGLGGAVAAIGIVALTGNLGGDGTVAVAPVTPSTIEFVERPVITGSGSPDRVAAVAARAIPSIVTVQIFGTPGESGVANGSGSGVIFSPDGRILTNNHVVEGAAEIKAALADGRTYPATLIGTDPLTDIAVISIDANDLPVIEFASIEDVSIGDLAVAVGNPLGLDGGPSVTSGVVSAFNRELEVDPFHGVTLFGLLQTDAPITRGSSGGALLDEEGRLLGITTAIGVSDVGAEGLGFAVPVDLVESIASDLIRDGSIRHAFLGISGQPAYELLDGVEIPIGAEIVELLEGSAIGEAGARVGDVIVALDGSPVSSMNLLVARLRSYRADEELDVTISRNGTQVQLSLTLDERPEDS